MVVEEILKGGQSTNTVVKIGNHVHRTLNPNSDYSHKVLKFLEERNYPYSPRFYGLDEKGREVLSFIEGEPGRNVSWSDEIIIKALEMMKELHDTTEGCELAGNMEVVCHGDLAPWNTIVKDYFPVGFIDFDTVHPGNRVDELAYFLWTFLELGNEIPAVVQAGRISMFCDIYGYRDADKFISSLLSEQNRVLAQRKKEAKTSTNEELKLLATQKISQIEEEINWVEINVETIKDAFL